MSHYLEEAARLDKQRAEALDANDRLMATAARPHVLDLRKARLSGVYRLAANDEAPDCKACTVTGGERAPRAHRRCDACRSLARVFQQQRSEART